MKTLLRLLFVYLPASLLAVIGLAAAVIWQQEMISKKDFEFLVDLGQRQGLAAVVAVIKHEVYGPDLSTAADASYGRETVPGRGHAPWVIRGNLDGRARVLKFALAPNLWAAYDTETASLYQVWEGSVLFEGAAYDYRHGPQPRSEGSWFIRNQQPVQWFLETGGEAFAADVRYLGHEYGVRRETAGLRFSLSAGDLSLELVEYPDVIERNGRRYFTRRFDVVGEQSGLSASFALASGESRTAAGTLEWPLQKVTPIVSGQSGGRGVDADASELELGEAVIQDGDCLGCHAETHRVTGPAWSQIAARFRGYQQEEVLSALAKSILSGSVNTWGVVPMPAHPDLNEQQARAAVAYILDVQESDIELQPPLNAAGEPYASTWDYQIKPRLERLHPSFSLENLAPEGFEPKVGGMDFRKDGKLLLSSWDKDGAVFLVDLHAPIEQRVKRIAEGLHEPLGLKVVDGRLFVLQKQELTELVDRDGDEVIDQYRAFSYDWPSSSNFHSFSFGLVHQEQHFYFLLSICVLPGGASCPEQLPTQGKLLRVDNKGSAEIVASGFRTPNGIAPGPNGDLYVADNQGDWLPASKLVRIQADKFYGSRAVPDEGVMAAIETAPVVWLPQDEVGNSPTEPLLLTEGPYQGQMIHGDIYNGGVKRVFIEQVEGQLQGAVFHFSSGFQGAVNRLKRGPDGAIYVGEIGNPPNWGEYGKPWYGLERMQYQGNNAYEILAVRARSDGFVLELTQPLDPAIEPAPSDLIVRQWFYHPNVQYGGPKYDPTELHATRLELSPDRRQITVQIPGLKAGYVVYLRLDDRYRSAAGNNLWTSEAWYTLNAIPKRPAVNQGLATTPEGEWTELFDGKTLNGWRNYGGPEDKVDKWVVNEGMLELRQEGMFPMWDLISSAIFGGASGDLIYYREKFRNFELALEWKISEGGNSGIFYLVADEERNYAWRTGVEMQVLDNDGHADGEIKTHRAGDLYDLISADPETVRQPGQWNEVRIKVHNNHIEHWLNGVKVVSVERGSEEWDRLVAASKFSDMPGFGKFDEGYIVLQDHGDPVWYRNIRIRKLGE